MSLSSTEILVVLIVALIVLGPSRLPGAMKTAGKAYREFRKVSGSVQREINQVVSETTGMFTDTAETLSGKKPSPENVVSDVPQNATYRPADEIPDEEESLEPPPADDAAGDTGS